MAKNIYNSRLDRIHKFYCSSFSWFRLFFFVLGFVCECVLAPFILFIVFVIWSNLSFQQQLAVTFFYPQFYFSPSNGTQHILMRSHKKFKELCFCCIHIQIVSVEAKKIYEQRKHHALAHIWWHQKKCNNKNASKRPFDVKARTNNNKFWNIYRIRMRLVFIM